MKRTAAGIYIKTIGTFNFIKTCGNDKITGDIITNVKVPVNLVMPGDILNF